MSVRLIVNGQAHDVEDAPGRTLLGVLRDDLGLTGARFGCGEGACGACVVLADGRPVPACRTGVAESAGRRILTIEGLARDGTLHPVQRAFLDEDAMQCGFCTSGLILASVALLARLPHPTDDEIREALASHLCRCAVHGRILRAIRRAAS